VRILPVALTGAVLTVAGQANAQSLDWHDIYFNNPKQTVVEAKLKAAGFKYLGNLDELRVFAGSYLKMPAEVRVFVKNKEVEGILVRFQVQNQAAAYRALAADKHLRALMAQVENDDYMSPFHKVPETVNTDEQFTKFLQACIYECDQPPEFRVPRSAAYARAILYSKTRSMYFQVRALRVSSQGVMEWRTYLYLASSPKTP